MSANQARQRHGSPPRSGQDGVGSGRVSDTVTPPVSSGHRLTSLTMGALVGLALAEDGVSQAEFCRRVGVSPKHLNEVIRGRAVATATQLDYWAFALGRRWSVALLRTDQ
jgi:hypothetical protein